MRTATAGPKRVRRTRPSVCVCCIYTSMYIRCYRCSDFTVREQLWDLIYTHGWISDHITYTLFYIPERYVPFALLIDSTLVHIRSKDYIA